jgi:hypothetical protein
VTALRVYEILNLFAYKNNDPFTIDDGFLAEEMLDLFLNLFEASKMRQFV